MHNRILNLFGCLLLIMPTFLSPASGAQLANPRAATPTSATSQRADGRDVRQLPDAGAEYNSAAAARSATGRRTTTTPARATSVVKTAPAATNRAATRQVVVSPARTNSNTSRAATTTVSRTAVTGGMSAVSSARSATSTSRAGVARAGTARATAVFNDYSKIGGGYAACREAYATCMDQLCANANDKYRRCFCSAKFTEFRKTEAALDEAKSLLIRFEDNNLNAVDKTVDEVNAMYSATAGEEAIKSDTSGAAAMLAEIGDLLSGKKAPAVQQSSSNSLGVLDLDFTSDVDDIWGDSGGSVFATNAGQDLSALEGQELFNSANSQCLQLVKDSCENTAVLNMAKSAYNILITQDCNAYEKTVDSQRKAVMDTVRTAEKYLREARLEEYRAHNSDDVNECIAKVRVAITADTACGVNYKRCLDYTGAYIDQNGDPIYSPRLFQLSDLIKLSGISSSGVAQTDVLSANANYNNFLESRKMFATNALDNCRDIAPIVWEEFKRAAIIEIAQAQAAKIEEVKMSCVNTMTECYDTQTNALKNFDKTTAQAAGALSAYAAKEMCKEKVIACAALYGDNDNCKFDDSGKLTGDINACGLTELITFVDNVDSVRVAEGCASAIDNYVKDLCTPKSGNHGFPWNCRSKSLGTTANVGAGKTGMDGTIAENIVAFAIQNCSDPSNKGEKDFASLPLQTRTQIEKAINDISESLDYQLMENCEELGGYWLDNTNQTPGNLLVAFYSQYYGGNTNKTENGRCIENTTMVQCLNYNTDAEQVATYDSARDECVFNDTWYKNKCESIGGYYDAGVCYVPKK